MTVRFLLVAGASALLFALLDGIINANPYARNVYAVFRPIVRPSVNAAAGVAIDVAYGFVMAGLFLLLAPALPGGPLTKGLVFGLIAWFFRVVMSAAGQWVMFPVPASAVAYMLATGLVQMSAVGALYGLFLPRGRL